MGERRHRIFTTDAIGGSSDSLYSNPEYDRLFVEQNTARSDEERFALMAQMQNIFYDDAPYHMLFHDDTLVAYRTDKFGGWTNQPANGIPLFGYGSPGYTALTEPVIETPPPSATPDASVGVSPAASASASPAPGEPDPTTSPGSALPIVVALLVAVGLVGGGLAMRRRSRASVDEDDQD